MADLHENHNPKPDDQQEELKAGEEMEAAPQGETAVNAPAESSAPQPEAAVSEEKQAEEESSAEEPAVAVAEKKAPEQSAIDEDEYWAMQDEGVEYTKDEYEQMMAMYDSTLTKIEEGQVITGKILRVTDNEVVLDIGFKSEGSVPLDEFKEPDEIKPGDEVEVFLEHLEDQEGAVVLSKKKADFMRVWEKIRVAHESDQPVEGTLVKKIKGGVVVDLMGVDAFLPGSQIALRRVPEHRRAARPDATSSRSSSSTSAAATSWSAAA